MKSRCANIGAFFFHTIPASRSLRIFRYKETEGSADGKRRFTWLHGKRPAAFRNAKLGIPSSFRRPRLPYGTYALREAGIVNIPEARSRKASNKREKIKNYGYHT